MDNLRERMKAASSLLAPYAVPHEGMLGREVREPEDATRFPFQRDRDRIIHTQAFRRLQGKTQVFVAGEGDHFRTRLTHTMEAAQIGRDIARTLRLNEDLTECIALAHDLGHPPFGHRGESALDAWMKEHDSSFEHNAQSVRIVTVLEEHSSLYQGLNLNREVIEGMQKHREALLEPSQEFPRSLSLEAQVVNCADEIAYLGHDCDDGLRAGLFSVEDVSAVPLVTQAIAQAKQRGTSLRGALIHSLVSALYAETERRLRDMRISTLVDAYAAPAPIVSFSRNMQEKLEPLRRFLKERMYGHPRVVGAGAEGQAIIRDLCASFFRSPPPKVLALREMTGGALPQAVKDYVAGMTDTFARASSANIVRFRGDPI